MRFRPLRREGSRSPDDGARAARFVRADLPDAQVSLDVCSRSLSLPPSSRARGSNAPDLCRQG